MKLPHDIDRMMERIRAAVAAYPKAALFELAEEGFDSPFEQLVACMISVRTLDETTVRTARRLFEAARSPREMARLGVDRIDDRIRACTFHHPKAVNIARIAETVLSDHGGNLPCDEDVLLSLPGVGPKTAHLVLGIACGRPRIGVDVHVHRVTNRWGYVQASSPVRTMEQLEAKLPLRHWVEINRLLVPFGKHICTRLAPACTTCPVLAWCLQVGVTAVR